MNLMLYSLSRLFVNEKTTERKVLDCDCAQLALIYPQGFVCRFGSWQTKGKITAACIMFAILS